MVRAKRSLGGAGGAAALALVLAACGGGNNSGNGNGQQGQNGGTSGAVQGGVLNVLGSGDVDYMDPNITYYTVGYLGLRPWSRQLYTYPAIPGKTEQTVPDLATGSPQLSSDGKTATITLRSGVDWNTSPARAVTAQDFVRGVKRTCNPAQPFGGIPDFRDLIVGYTSFCNGFAKVKPNASAMASYLEGHSISGVQAKNSSTIVLKLTHPASYLQDMLAMPAFSPAPKEYDQYVPASLQLAQHTISDGPYYVASYNPTKMIDYKRNSAWKRSTDPIRKAYVDEIKVDETVSQQSTQQQLETGSPSADMEWDNYPPTSRLPALINGKDPNLNLGDTNGTNPYIVFNTVSPNNSKALASKTVRQALEYALNRQDIIQALGGSQLNPPLTHILPSNILGGEQSFDLYQRNVSKAKQMLSQAGVKNLTLKMLYRSAIDKDAKMFAVVQQDLRQLGITVKGVAVPNADFYTKYLEVPNVAKRGVWDLAPAGWFGDWYGNAALTFFKPLLNGSPSYPPQGDNWGFYSDSTENKLISQAASAKTQNEAKQLWHQADMQAMKDAAWFPITNPKQPNYHASQVHNAVYIGNLADFDPTNVWLSKGKQGG